MSYTIAICHAPLPDEYHSAVAEIARLNEQPEPNRAVFDTLIEQLTARYPCLTEVDDDDVDDCPWLDGPLRRESYQRVYVLGLNSPFVDDVLPFVIETATRLGFTVLDWQTGKIAHPSR